MSFTKKIFPALATLLLVPWPVAYAYTYADNITNENANQIEVAEVSATPNWSTFQKIIGGVTTPGDLFYIDAISNAGDIKTTLYITNTRELIQRYRYLILKVGVYTEGNDGEWREVSTCNGESIPDTFITLRDAQVSFTLPGYARYKITIDDGSFYCTGTGDDGGNIAPQFYLTAH